jgi:hypothetical protein
MTVGQLEVIMSSVKKMQGEINPMIRAQLIFVCFLFCCVGVVRQSGGQEISYQRDIRPLLAKNCFACHGPDENAREADLRLDIRESALSAENHPAAIIPGRPETSELWQRIQAKDPDKKMPPPETGHALSPEQIALIKMWIESGAEYAEHWSRVAPKQPPLPALSNPSWPANPIDHFVLAQWDKRGLKGSDRADRATLLRRLSLDLTGLPPTVEDVDSFILDASPNAYEKRVDQLLQSDRFGEHWARMWLDQARYSDTKGYEKDQPREIWRYRDWVIQALNQDLPFDQFTIEQIAGDLLPDPTSDQILATAFHRNTMTNDEGGTDNEEFRVLAVKDRVDTTLQVWMGLTMGCAKCHTHKYDPIRQEEYYQFYALFNQTADADRPNDEPRAATPTLMQSMQLQHLDESIQRVEASYRTETEELKVARQLWVQNQATKSPWKTLAAQKAKTNSETTLVPQSDGAILAQGPASETETYEIIFASLPEGEYDALRLEALTDPSMKDGGPGRNGNDPNFVVSEIKLELLNPEDPSPLAVTIKSAKADFSQNNWPVENAFDGDTKTGWAISPQQRKPHVAVFRFDNPLQVKSGQRLKVQLVQEYGNRLVLGKFRIALGAGSDKELAPTLQDLSELARIPQDARTASQMERLAEAFRQEWPATAKIYSQLQKLQQERSQLVSSIPRTPIMKELGPSQHRETRIHLRGNFLQPGDVVQPGVPQAFNPFPEGQPMNRLGVAQWLVADDNPLTSRVAVNRIWARFFGRGLVETEEDFGVQGTLPTHPDLLDWLAIAYRTDMDWSTKELCKTIVMSKTYQQSSNTSEEHQRKDPDNRWLTRSPRFRLPAETIRDQALQVAGLLSPKIGGPSVMPPQPDGIWQTTYSTLKWNTSAGPDRYRRALYTYWRRTSPYPSMLTFDAGSREVCVIRRVRTNTPLQALVTLNDPVFLEAAGGLGQRMIKQQTEDRVRLHAGFRMVLSRSPNELELNRLGELLQVSIEEFRDNPDEAKSLLKSGQIEFSEMDDLPKLAAYVLVGNVLLNLDETLMRN